MQNYSSPHAYRLYLALTVLGTWWLAGCMAPLDETADDEPTAQVAQPLTYYFDGVTWTYYTDHSAGRVQVKVRVCETIDAKRSQVVDCMTPHGYALVGGGARTTHVDGQGALIREARLLDDYFFRARSSDHDGVSNHRLTVYAVGVRLVGAHVQTLRKSLSNWSRNDYGSWSQNEDFPDDYLFSGGFYLNANRFIQESKGVWGDGWQVTGADHGHGLDDHIKMFVRKLPKSIIEGFGALELEQRKSVSQWSSGGIGGISMNARSNWAIVGYGGDADTSTGVGRFLYGIGPNGGSARSTAALSRPIGDSSTGYTTAHAVEARHVSGSRGVCNTGPRMNASHDACIADVCAVRPSCCNSTWDSQCVGLAESLCNEDCSDYTCSTPSFDPNWWEQNADNANCYAYAANVAGWGRPGYASYYYPDTTAAGMTDGLISDGVRESTRLASCPDRRTKVALFIKPAPNADFHFMRRDSNGRWSHKFQSSAPKNVDDNGNLITNPETAVVGNYAFAGYFCLCSDSQQGQGHTELDYPFSQTEPPWGWFNPQAVSD